VFDINSDNDAEVSLQIANALTLALLNYRAKMIPLLVCFLHCVFYVCFHCWPCWVCEPPANPMNSCVTDMSSSKSQSVPKVISGTSSDQSSMLMVAFEWQGMTSY